jgi:hypothetical protein
LQELGINFEGANLGEIAGVHPKEPNEVGVEGINQIGNFDQIW